VQSPQSRQSRNHQSPNLLSSADVVISQVLDVVASKTGYPKDMLDLDLDLEADLGIDTVKQAETFAAIRETFSIPVQEGLNLREYPTLASVVGFVRTNRPDLARGGPLPGDRSSPQSPSRTRLPISNQSQSPVADVVVSQVLTWSPTRRAIRRTCLSSTSIWKPTWASTR
jgi:acyl carrier protein